MKIASSIFTYILENPRCTPELFKEHSLISQDVSVYCMSSTCSRMGFVCKGKNKPIQASVKYADCHCNSEKCELDLKTTTSCVQKSSKTRDNLSSLFRARAQVKPDYACEKPSDPFLRIENCTKKNSKVWIKILRIFLYFFCFKEIRRCFQKVALLWSIVCE